MPHIPGLPGFKGAVLHTAKWDASVALAGKKV
jgi:cation diffusion facilitator CzcD-associated flavoprotein CzcO